jgi:hypothetical protein
MYGTLKGDTYQFIIVVEFICAGLWIGIVSPHFLGGELENPYGEYVFRIISITCSTMFLLCSFISLIGYYLNVDDESKDHWAFSFTSGIILFLISLKTFIVAIKGIRKNHKNRSD